jgi:hypothetical protein
VTVEGFELVDASDQPTSMNRVRRAPLVKWLGPDAGGGRTHHVGLAAEFDSGAARAP